MQFIYIRCILITAKLASAIRRRTFRFVSWCWCRWYFRIINIFYSLPCHHSANNFVHICLLPAQQLAKMLTTPVTMKAIQHLILCKNRICQMVIFDNIWMNSIYVLKYSLTIHFGLENYVTLFFLNKWTIAKYVGFVKTITMKHCSQFSKQISKFHTINSILSTFLRLSRFLSTYTRYTNNTHVQFIRKPYNTLQLKYLKNEIDEGISWSSLLMHGSST